MNIFLIDPDYDISAAKLYARDPIRANKQILECAQLLAFYEINATGSTTILAQSGLPYRATKAQLNHPISRHMLWHRSAYDLCWGTFQGLIKIRPDHACARSVVHNRREEISDRQEYLVCRKGYEVTYAKTLKEYASVILDYLINHKWK